MPPSTATAYPSSAGTRLAGPLVEIVVDGGPVHGYGHVGRCLALWEALGERSSFSTAEPAVQRFLADRGAATAPAPGAPVVLLDRVEPTRADEVRELQDAGRRVVLLDDLGDGRELADAVVDPPTAAHWPPAAGTVLGGFEHVLLRGEVRAAERAAEPRDVLLALGGSDPTQLTPRLAAALAAAAVPLVVNLGPGYAGDRDVPGRIVASPADFAGELGAARLLVAAYGHSLLEAAYLGVPALIVVTREDHREHAEAFVANGTAEIVAPDAVGDRVAQLLADEGALQAMAARGPSLVDGRGAERVAATLLSLAA